MIHERPPEPGDHRLSLEQVLAAERPAWAQQDGVVYHYDDINWWQLEHECWRPADAQSLPLSGWWDRADCCCEWCDGEAQRAG